MKPKHIPKDDWGNNKKWSSYKQIETVISVSGTARNLKISTENCLKQKYTNLDDRQITKMNFNFLFKNVFSTRNLSENPVFVCFFISLMNNI